MRSLKRGGPFLRVADPDWDDPLSGDFARAQGGRWNPPGSFPVTYLCGTVGVARANVLRKLAGQPYGPEDLRADAGPVLVETRVPEDRYANAVTEAGLRSLGLPVSYPRARGRVVPHSRCQPVGTASWDSGLAGVVARSAAPGAPPDGEELAHFGRGRRLRVRAVTTFDDWFW